MVEGSPRQRRGIAGDNHPSGNAVPSRVLLLKDESGLEAGYAYMLRDAARRYALLGWLAVYPPQIG